MEIQVGDRLVEVTILSKDGDKVAIDVGGKIYNVDICMFADGQCSILNEGRSYNPFIIHDKGSKHYSVSLDYSVYEVDMLDSQAKYMRMRKQSSSAGKQGTKILSPMPAKVISIFVEPGQQMHAGDVVMTVEAMKMQSSITVAEDCTIEAVHCGVGDSVSADQLLITLKVNDNVQ